MTAILSPPPGRPAARRVVRTAAGLLVAVTAGLCLLGVGRAQEDNSTLELLLIGTPEYKAPDKDKPAWALRPNITQDVFAFVENTGEDDVTVTAQLQADGVTVKALAVKAIAGKVTPVVWPRTPPADPKQIEPKLTELKAPVVFRLVDGKEKVIGAPIKVEVYRPSNYLTPSVKYYPSEVGKNRLEAVVTANEHFKGPPCRVELVVRPDRIPGLVARERKRGLYADHLTIRNTTVHLQAEDLQFNEKGTVNGLVYLNADGYPRAFTFKTTFAGPPTPTTADRIDNPSVVFVVPPAADPSKPVPIQLEVDDLSQKDEDTAVIKVELVKKVADPEKAGATTESVTELLSYQGERQKRLLYVAGWRQGGITFRPEVKDHDTRLDVSSVFGPALLRARVYDAKGEPITFRDKLNDKLDVKEIIQTIILDNTPPEDVQWVGLPKQAIRGRSITLKARGSAESGIRDVVFWVGKPTPDGKIPVDADQLPGKLTADKEKTWATTLDVKADQPPLLTVSVQFTSGVGLQKNLQAQIPVVDPPKPPVPKKDEVKPKKASIAGTVVEGDRPQVGLPVELRNEARRVVDTTKTAEEGKYLFKDLDPGTYRVRATKSASRTSGEKEVVVKAGEQKTGIEIKLYR